MYLPSQAESSLKFLAEEMKRARKRRRWTIAELGSKMGVTRATVSQMEKGKHTISIGTYLAALWLLGLTREIYAITQPSDTVGHMLEDSRLPKNVKHKKPWNNF